MRVNAGGIVAKHTEAEIEAFAQEYAISEDANKAYLLAKPNTKASQSSIYSLSCRMSKLPEVVERVNQLKSKIKVKAESRFSITVEQRLKWLKEITEAGIAAYNDSNGQKRRENLAAARAAIATMNEMLGTEDGIKKDRPSFSVTLRVEDASDPE